ncbi:hypothetical protein T02_6769 [Trichinella nativa]|uniref:Uncharacterized protein n=1 Tax=Trichinella nativa TaxID=6335 RepID=A0A0V1KHA8_9BILA|nr:hypothetical protein T02_6769 [Trichinella nativa]
MGCFVRNVPSSGLLNGLHLGLQMPLNLPKKPKNTDIM